MKARHYFKHTDLSVDFLKFCNIRKYCKAMKKMIQSSIK